MSPTRQPGWSSSANPLQDEIKQVFDRFFGDTDTDASSVVTSAATGRNGVLEISIPKRPETTPRRITVQ